MTKILKLAAGSLCGAFIGIMVMFGMGDAREIWLQVVLACAATGAVASHFMDDQKFAQYFERVLRFLNPP